MLSRKFIMKLSNKPRIVAVQILQQVFNETNGKSLTEAFIQYSVQLKLQDQSLAKELCYGICRWKNRLEAQLNELMKKPLKAKELDLHCLLLISLYQLLYLRVPDHAVISEAVNTVTELKKVWAKSLVNAVLRQAQREKETLLEKKFDQLAIETAHPQWLTQLIENAWPEQAVTILNNNNIPGPMTIRINTQKISRENYQTQLAEQDLLSEPAFFSPDGLNLTTPTNPTQLPGFQEGICSVQDEAAQLAAYLLEIQPEQKVLDACAAPGGKTGHILELCPTAQVVALDHDAQRLLRVSENLQRLKVQAQCIHQDAKNFASDLLFDRILLDAPCSGTGVIRRHPDIKWLRRKEDIEQYAAQQLQLLKHLWTLLKPKGILLYATCSILPQENTQVIQQFLQDQTDAEEITLNAAWGITTAAGRQLFPQVNGHDGFFYAKLRKL